MGDDQHDRKSAAYIIVAFVFAWLVIAAMLTIYLLHKI